MHLVNYKGLIQYFIDGLVLFNRSIELFFPLALLTIVNALNNQAIQGGQENFLLGAISFISLFIQIVYSLSVPAFFDSKQKNKSLTYGEILKVLLTNTKRLVIPFIALCVLFIIIVVIGLFATTMLRGAESLPDFSNINTPFSQFLFISTVLFSPFSFAAIFFSIEGRGLFSSLKKSVLFTFANIWYVIVLALVSFILYSLVLYIPEDSFFGNVSQLLLYSYIGLWLTASTLLYYQARTHK